MELVRGDLMKVGAVVGALTALFPQDCRFQADYDFILDHLRRWTPFFL